MAFLRTYVLAIGLCAALSSCPERCVNAGHCCSGNSSSCQAPSCQMGCNFAASVPDEATCNATCTSAKNRCDFTFAGTTYTMCGDCAQRWLNPATLTPEILPGPEPFFPPGFNLPSCTSCDDIKEECMLGCRLAFDPSLNPLPPSPSPPAPVPEPPAPWPFGPGFNFSGMLSSHMVLQAAPAQSAVFGNVGSQDPSAAVSVTLSSSTGEQIKVSAVISSGRWKAVLPPQPSVSTVTWNITATLTCTGGACSGSAQLSDVIFGDVFFCFGQSNLWLQLRYTYARNSTKAAIATGAYDNIRLMSGDSQVNGITPTTIPIHPWRRIRDALSIPSENTDSLDQFSAMCLHFAEAVTDAFTAKGAQPPVIGLLGMAIGGSMIEEWITNDVAAACYGADPNANGAALNHLLWDNIIVPSLDMTLKAFLYYQGENSAGNLHGNSAENAGYACLMPGLVRSFREAWSATPGTTDPNAPFGIVTLSTADSEGAADIASFRFAQAASYFAVPNPALPNSFLAHAYDLADVWGDDCGDQPQTKKCQNCDTTDPDYNCLQQFYMGPSIHPRLKKPVGQRLAAAGLPLIYPEAGFAGPITGPTLSGCSLASDSLILHINATLLAGAPLIVRSYNMSDPRRSGLSVLINEKPAAGSGNWMPLTFTLGSDGVSLVVDLSALNGVIPTAVKYAWGPSDGAPNSGDVVCCDAASTLDECKPGMCPLSVSLDRAPFGGLPANPFIAQIINGSCMCPWPQECNA